MRIVHISDTHFGTEVPQVLDALETVIKSLSPTAIILSGDVTQRARTSQFEDAKVFLERFNPCPRLVIPGNHDIPLFNFFSRFLTPYRHYQRTFPQREPLLVVNDVAVAGLDATTPFRHTRGVLDLDRTKAVIEKARQKLSPDGLLILCIHQPALVYRPEDVPNRLEDASKLIKVFSEYKVDLIVSGHIHLPLICTTQQEYPGLDWQVLFSGAGTACSHRVRPPAPNSFNVIVSEDSRNAELTVNRYDFQADENHFVLSEKLLFSRTETGWAPG